MQNTLFYRLGKCIYHFRWPIIILWVLLILSCIPFLPRLITPFKTSGFIDEHSPSAIADQYLIKELGYDSKNTFLIMYHSPTLQAKDPVYLEKIKKSLSELKNYPIKSIIFFPEKQEQISKDRHTAYVAVILKTDKPISEHLFEQLKDSIKTPAQMKVSVGGESFFVDHVNQQTQRDLAKADLIATPITIITLIFVFGSLVAAILPVALGIACALIILTSLFFLGHLFTLSIFTLNIALLLGLCLNLDYSLFIISRFRDELNNGLSPLEAIAVTQAYAGKAIFFSGLAVLISLSALFLFPVNILFSVAVGGMIAVFFAVLIAMVLLPAVLSVLKTKINLLAVRSFKPSSTTGFHFWNWLAKKIVRRSLLFFFPILIFLLMLGYPFVFASFGISDYKIFPEHSKSRSFYDNYSKKFDIKELNPILLVVHSKFWTILSEHSLSNVYDLVHKLQKNPLIKKVNSIVSLDSKMTKQQYITLYHSEQSLKKPEIKKLLARTTNEHSTLISIIGKYPIHSTQTQELIGQLHHLKMKQGLSAQLTGTPVSNQEVLDTIYHRLPYAILWIMVFTYLVLLFLLRSLFLPFKAILMNLLSLCACYGALVLVFQEGHLSHLLNFQPQGLLDISLLVIIFCALFGFSMDYEVFLLSRIKEFYEIHKDNTKSIIFGIEKSSRIINSAAIIVIVLCCSFLVADVLMVKAFGLGIAVAIFVDAFLIRTLLVPSTMALLKKWNWYLPKCLDKIIPKL